MATRLERIQRSLMGRQAAHRLAMAMRGDVQKRVVHCLISDSNGLHTDYGLLGGLTAGFSFRWPCFGTGLVGAKHSRTKFTRGGGGGQSHFPLYGETTNSSPGVRLSIQVDNASWNHGTLTLTKAGAFANYTHQTGNRLFVTAATSGTAGEYVIASRVSDDAITLATSIGASASAIYAMVETVKGGTGNSAVPSDFARGWNMPRTILPLGSTMVYVASSQSYSMSTIMLNKLGPLTTQGRLTHNAYALAGTSGAFTMEFYDSDAAAANTQIGTTVAVSANGTAGDLVIGRATTARGDRLTSTARDYVRASVGAGAGTNQGAMAHLASCVTNADMPYGSAVQGFMMRSGWSGYDLAELLLNFIDDNTIDNYLKMTRDQWSADAGGSGSGIANFIFYLGFNDHYETANSVGTAAVSSGTAAGYIDNIQAMVTKIETRWNALFGAGTAASECVFTVIPSHPISDSPTTPGTGSNAAREGLTQTYRQAAFVWAAGAANRVAIDVAALLGTNPYARLTEQGHTFNYTTDYLHLSPAGYNALGGLIAEAIDIVGDAAVNIGSNRLLVGSLGGG